MFVKANVPSLHRESTNSLIQLVLYIITHTISIDFHRSICLSKCNPLISGSKVNFDFFCCCHSQVLLNGQSHTVCSVALRKCYDF